MAQSFFASIGSFSSQRQYTDEKLLLRRGVTLDVWCRLLRFYHAFLRSFQPWYIVILQELLLSWLDSVRVRVNTSQVLAVGFRLHPHELPDAVTEFCLIGIDAPSLRHDVARKHFARIRPLVLRLAATFASLQSLRAFFRCSWHYVSQCSIGRIECCAP